MDSFEKDDVNESKELETESGDDEAREQGENTGTRENGIHEYEQDHPPGLRMGSPEQASQPLTPRRPSTSTSESPEKAQVHIAPNLLEMITGIFATPEEQRMAQKQRDLNEVVHQLLIVGLIISTLFMLAGIILDLVLGRQAPTIIPDLREVFTRIAVMRPSGFLSLGLLVLIATPIIRVIGSIIVFIYERDWRFAGITLLVFLIVLFSILFGSA